MVYAVVAFGVLIAVLSGVGVVQPRRLMAAVADWEEAENDFQEQAKYEGRDDDRHRGKQKFFLQRF